MRVKLHKYGYTKIYDNGVNTSVNGGYDNDEEVQEFVANGGVVEPFKTQAEIDARLIEENNTQAKAELEQVYKDSLGDMLNWIANQPNAPQALKDKAIQASNAKSKIVGGR